LFVSASKEERTRVAPLGQEIETVEKPVGCRRSQIAVVGMIYGMLRTAQDAVVRIGVGQGAVMDWARMLAYVTGTVDQELLARNEYLVAENRILKAQLNGRLKLSDGERKMLGEIGYQKAKPGRPVSA
jgi:hypothetical protein